MNENETSRLFAEVYSFLQHCDEEVTEKIPKKLMTYLADNMMAGVYITKIDDLSRDAKAIIALFNLVYLIAPEEREEHRLILVKNELVDLLKALIEQEGDSDECRQMLEMVQNAETAEDLAPFLEMFDQQSAFEDLKKDEEEFRAMFL